VDLGGPRLAGQSDHTVSNGNSKPACVVVSLRVAAGETSLAAAHFRSGCCHSNFGLRGHAEVRFKASGICLVGWRTSLPSGSMPSDLLPSAVALLVFSCRWRSHTLGGCPLSARWSLQLTAVNPF